MKKIFLLSLVFVGILFMSEIASAGPMGSCYCNMVKDGVSYPNDIAPLDSDGCVDGQDTENPLSPTTYTDCKWVNVQDGFCNCEVSYKLTEDAPDPAVFLPGGFSGFVKLEEISCTVVPYEKEITENILEIYNKCSYTPALAEEVGCYCDGYGPDGINSIPELANTKMLIVGKGACTEEQDYLLVKFKNCAWNDEAPPDAGTPPISGTPTGTTGLPPAPPPEAPTPVKTKSMTAGEAFKAGKEAGSGVVPINLENPLGKGRIDIRTILGDIVDAGMGILGSVTLLVFVYGGFMWLTSAGSAEKVKKGSQTMMWAVIGLFLIFGSYAILGLVLEGIGAKQQTSSTNIKNIGSTDIGVGAVPTEENPIISDECGDGVIGAGETCDDANVKSGDGCSSICQKERCRAVSESDLEYFCSDYCVHQGVCTASIDSCDVYCDTENDCELKIEKDDMDSICESWSESENCNKQKLCTWE